MKKSGKILSVLLCAAMLLNSSGCNNSDNNIPPVQTDTKHITFSWWGGNGRHEYTIDGVDVFQQLNNDIRVNCKYGVWNGYTKRQNIYMKSHEEPDVMQINFSWLKDYSPDGNGFYDIYKLADNIDLSNYTEAELAYGEVDGKLNAIPIAFNAESIYYNKDMYDKYGLDIPDTWDDFFEAAKVMSKDGIYPISMGDKALFFFALSYFEQTTGKEACNENGELCMDKEDIKVMLNFYKRLLDAHVMPPIEQHDRNLFLQCKSAATMGWVSDGDRYCQSLIDTGANVIVGPYPKLEGVEKLGWYVKPATMYAISSSTDEPEAAAKLLDFLVNNKEMAVLQQTEKGIPISDSAIDALESQNMLNGIAVSANKMIEENQSVLSVMDIVLEDENVYLGFIDEGNYYIYGKSSIDEAAQRVYDKFYQQ